MWTTTGDLRGPVEACIITYAKRQAFNESLCRNFSQSVDDDDRTRPASLQHPAALDIH